MALLLVAGSAACTAEASTGSDGDKQASPFADCSTLTEAPASGRTAPGSTAVPAPGSTTTPAPGLTAAGLAAARAPGLAAAPARGLAAALASGSTGAPAPGLTAAGLVAAPAPGLVAAPAPGLVAAPAPGLVAAPAPGLTAAPAPGVTAAASTAAGSAAAGSAGSADLPDLELPCFTGGKSVRLSELRGPAVINLWASWCGPCREELPAMQRLADATAGRLHVIGVDSGDDRDAAVDFATDRKVTLPTLSDPDKKLLGRIGRVNIPITVFVDAAGKRLVYDQTPPDDAQLAALVRAHTGVTVKL